MNPLSETVLIVTVVLCFGLALVGVVGAARAVRSYQRDTRERLFGLRIGRMLRRIGIEPKRYLRRAAPLDVEKHLWRCERCPDPEACDAFLEERGDDDDPRRFCPNFSELQAHLDSRRP